MRLKKNGNVWTPEGYVITDDRPFKINPKAHYEWKVADPYDPFNTNWYKKKSR